jgi:hypothetical protein
MAAIRKKIGPRGMWQTPNISNGGENDQKD